MDQGHQGPRQHPDQAEGHGRGGEQAGTQWADALVCTVRVLASREAGQGAQTHG